MDHDYIRRSFVYTWNCQSCFVITTNGDFCTKDLLQNMYLFAKVAKDSKKFDLAKVANKSPILSRI